MMMMLMLFFVFSFVFYVSDKNIWLNLIGRPFEIVFTRFLLSFITLSYNCQTEMNRKRSRSSCIPETLKGLWTVGSGKGSSCPNTLRRRNLRPTHCVWGGADIQWADTQYSPILSCFLPHSNGLSFVERYL